MYQVISNSPAYQNLVEYLALFLADGRLTDAPMNILINGLFSQYDCFLSDTYSQEDWLPLFGRDIAKLFNEHREETEDHAILYIRSLAFADHMASTDYKQGDLQIAISLM